ncbi:MAG: ADP-glyceromanno-heptose 6-epimerase, partial [Candidatus Zophobacter franzmannii]|nr:ADP-glyceromanno-heptose 6-epimerase [Candidatus Zophobacter franzmannii]
MDYDRTKEDKMIIVTGGAGFIGSAMLAKLNAKGREDIIVVDSLKSSDKWKNLQGKRFDDYLDKSEFISKLDCFKSADAIIHMGACSSTTETDADYLMANNFKYSKTLAEWSKANSVRFIYASSAATYGSGEKGYCDNEIYGLKPLNMYGYSKQLMDEYLVKSGLYKHCVGFKFFNVFGPNEYHKGEMKSVVYKAYHQILKEGKVSLFKSYQDEYGDGEQMRDFIYVKDVVDVMYKFLEQKDWFGIFNLGTGKAKSWNELVSAVFRAMNLPETIDYIEMPDYLKAKYQYFTEADMSNLT